MHLSSTLQFLVLNWLFWSSHSVILSENESKIAVNKEIELLGQIASKVEILGILNTEADDNLELKTLLNDALQSFEILYEKRAHQFKSPFIPALFRIYFRSNEKSIEFLERFLKTVNNHYGPNHIKSSDLLNTLGIIISEENPEKGAKYFVKSLNIKNLPDLKQAPLLFRLALVYQDTHERQKALLNFEKSYQIYENHQESHEDAYLRTIEYLGIVSGDLGQYEKALMYHEASLEITKKMHGDKSRQVVFPLNNIAIVYKHMKRYPEALTILLEQLEIDKIHLGPMDKNLGATYYNLAAVYLKLGKIDENFKYMEKALEIQVHNFGENSLETQSHLNNLGVTHYERGEYKKALEYYKKVLNILNVKLGPGHFKSISVLGNIAMVYRDLKMSDKSIEMFELKMSIVDKYLDKGRLGHEYEEGITIALFQLGLLYMEKDENDKSVENFEKFCQYIVTYEPEGYKTNIYYSTTLDLLKKIYDKLGDVKKADEMQNKLKNLKNLKNVQNYQKIEL